MSFNVSHNFQEDIFDDDIKLKENKDESSLSIEPPFGKEKTKELENKNNLSSKSNEEKLEENPPKKSNVFNFLKKSNKKETKNFKSIVQDFVESENEISEMVEAISQEILVKIDKIIYQDESKGFCVFSGSPAKNKAIYSDVYGKKKREFNFICQIKNDEEALSFIVEEAEIVCLGKWVIEEKYGIQFEIKDVCPIFIEEEKDIEKFILKKGLKSLTNKEASYLIDFAENREYLLKTLLEDNLLLLEAKKEIYEIYEEVIDHFSIFMSWFHYKQSYFFANEMSKFEMKKSKAYKIYNKIIEKEATKINIFDKDKHGKIDLAQENLGKIYLNEQLHKEAYEVFFENPYKYLSVKGVGFKELDKVALNYGITESDPRRVAALIQVEIEQKTQSTGNTVVKLTDLIDSLSNVKGITKQLALEGLKTNIQAGRLIVRTMDLGEGELKYITTFGIFNAEYESARKINLILEHTPQIKPQAIEEIKSETFNNDDSQTKAILNSYQNPISIITGGPGTGKTKTIMKLIYLFQKYHTDKSIYLLAPTGLASKRILENIEQEGLHVEEKPSTIHLFIHKEMKEEVSVEHHNSIFIVDESSMIDSILLNNFLKYVGKGSQIIFVGDIDQIPPVNIGQIMRDLMNNDRIVISKLINIHRVSKESNIPYIAKMINKGIMPEFNQNEVNFEDDFVFIKTKNEKETFQKIEDTVRFLLKNNKYEKEDIQIISPQARGEVGVIELNRKLKWMLNKTMRLEDYEFNLENFNSNKVEFLEGDKIINLKNNYELNIFNGEMGYVTEVNPYNKTFSFQTSEDKEPLLISNNKRGDFTLGYAITVHKSQGSEKPVIIFPLVRSHLFTLNKFLVYTGVTRAKSKVILVGDLDVFKACLRKTQEGKRITTLNYEIEHYKEKENTVDQIKENLIYDDLITED